MEIGEFIGKQVYTVRRKRQMTQSELASLAHISQGMVSLLERGCVGDISVRLLLDLARSLEIPVLDLLDGL